MKLNITRYISKRIVRLGWVLVALMGVQLLMAISVPSHKTSQTAPIPSLNNDIAVNNQHSID